MFFVSIVLARLVYQAVYILLASYLCVDEAISIHQVFTGIQLKELLISLKCFCKTVLVKSKLWAMRVFCPPIIEGALSSRFGLRHKFSKNDFPY